MAFSKRLSIFDIPLLKDEITKYLSKHDIYCCVLVSKCWNSWFIPILWRNAIPSKPVTPDEFFRLMCSQEYVRSIHGLQLHSALRLPEQDESSGRALKKMRTSGSSKRSITKKSQYPLSFPQLQRLHLILGQEYSPISDSMALRIAKSSPHLSFLKLEISIYQVHDVLIQSLKAMAQLKMLDISARYIPTISLQDLVEACSNIDSVRLNFKSLYKTEINHNEENYTESPIYQRFSHRLQDTKIKELFVHFSLAADEIIVLIPLLRKCPLLEKLKIERVRLPNTISHIASVFEEGRCPWLKCFDVGVVSKKIQVRQYVSRMLDAIGRGSRGNEEESQNNKVANDLGGYMSGFSRDNDNEVPNHSILETLILNESVPMRFIPVESITHRHAQTLTHLDVPRVHLSVLGDLMSELYRVRYVRTQIWLEHRTAYGADLIPMLNRQWTCLSMKHLDLDVDGLMCNIRSIMDPDWNESLADRCIGYLMTQIARLRELEELRLKCEVNLLTREVGPGYLTRLATLAELKVLKLVRISVPSLMTDAYLGEEEAEWMHEYWPRLREITYKRPVFPANVDGFNGVYVNVVNNSSEDEVNTGNNSNRKVEDLFMTTFLELRPWLEIYDQ